MPELIVFCNPLEVYAGRLEQEVARDYTAMAIDEYDKLISFDDEYLPFSKTPDYQSCVGKKNGRNISLSFFFQDMVRVGGIGMKFTSSSYLFNPESSTPDLLLPDMDIVQIEGVAQVREAAEEIKRFYERFGWRAYVFDGKISDRRQIIPTSSRLNGPIEIIDPIVLREIAREKVGYDMAKLCF